MSAIKQLLKEIADSNRFTGKLHDKYIDYKFERDFIRRKRNSKMQGVKGLRNTKCGKRCFIIGNGPSLTISDLDKLKDEDTFATNRIYRIFSRTDWRPTYYVCQDRRVADDVKNELAEVVDKSEHLFLNSSLVMNMNSNYKNSPKIHYIFLNDRDRDGDFPCFSDEIAEQIYEGNSVTYACIQIAVYMGYSEIYIIGVDHNYNIEQKKDGTVVTHAGVQNYMPELELKEGEKTFLPALDRSTFAYRKAKMICEERDIIICNATRGGKLEEFERVNLDDIV